jgi:TonB-linked SusC/RagA family outer membrane protein
MRSRGISLLAILLLFVVQSFAQNRTITGRVTDAQGAGMQSVSVTVKGTTNGTQTGSDGSFSISAPANAVLVFSSVGFINQEVNTAGRSSVNVSLESQSANLNEVVVIGYGTARRKDLTGAVASVKSKDFNKGVIVSPDQAIQGKAAGVMVINNSGQPGGATTVRIRGTSSIRSGQQPLYVIDGVQLSGNSARPGASGSGIGSTPGTNPLNFINPNDIASVEILKDASATAIYGSRGANGVILITTKRGVSGDPSVDASVSVGVSSVMKRLETLNASEYIGALKAYGLPTTVYSSTTPTANFGSDVDAFDAITRSAITQNYSVGVSGGNPNGRYRISLGYLNQEGVVRESEFKKYTGNLTGNFKLLNNRKLNLDYSLLVSGTQEQIAPISNDAGFTGSIIGQALQWNPTHPLYKTDGSIYTNNLIGNTTVNPLALLAAYDDHTNESVILASIAPSYKITNNLEYKLQYSMTRRVGNERGEVKRFINLDGINGRGVAGINNAAETNQQVTNTLNYTKQVSSAVNLNLLAGHEFIKYTSSGSGLFGQDFTDAGDLHYYDIMAYSTQGGRGIYSYANPTTELQSFFGRAIFNIRDKYVINLSMRADGSSKFGANNKYGYFPQASAAWTITNEDFLKGNSTVNNLKLRASWGRTGNQEFPSGASLRRYSFGQQSISQSNFDNPDLKWETSTTFDVGVDFSLFGNRVFGSLGYFNKATSDVLFEQNVAQPGPSGIKYWINLPGEITNKGVEVDLNMAVLNKRDLVWNLGFKASFIDNNVEGISGFYETGGLHGQGISGATAQRLVSGQPLNVYYLAIHEGIDKATGQSIYTGGDPSVNKFYVGSPNPKTLLGISTDVTYKKFSAYINMNGSFGNYLYNNTANTVLPIGNLGSRNVAKSVINSGGTLESLANPITPSTRYLEKGNYLKMANATLAYNLGSFGKTFRNVNISLTGQNLFVITKFTGFDPEVNTDKSIGGIPSLGIEYTPYPTARTFLFGVNVSL